MSSEKKAEDWIAELELITLPGNVGYMKPTSVNTLEVIGRRGQPRKASSTIYYLQKVTFKNTENTPVHFMQYLRYRSANITTSIHCNLTSCSSTTPARGS